MKLNEPGDRAKDKERKSIAYIMEKLECSEEEAKDVLATDIAIEEGRRTKYDLTPAQEKEINKLFAIGSKISQETGKKTIKRERKPVQNDEKEQIISLLVAFLQENSEISCENFKIVNKTREFTFKIGEKDYGITLVEKRKKKE